MKIFNELAFEKAPSCVLLDLDNTLYEYMPCHEAGLSEATRIASELLGLGAREFSGCVGHARTQLKSRVGAVAASHNRLLYFQRALEIAGLGSQPMVALELYQAYWRAFLTRSELFDEALDFLDDLRIADVPIVIVSDLTAQIQMRKVLFWKLDRYVDWVVTSEETGADKPDAQNFEMALAKLGGIEGPVWMIGDDPDKDAKGAKVAVGASTILRVDSSWTKSKRPDFVDAQFEHFADVRKLFRAVKRP